MHRSPNERIPWGMCITQEGSVHYGNMNNDKDLGGGAGD